MKSIHLLLMPLFVLMGFNLNPEFQNSAAGIKQAPAEDLLSYLRCHRQAKNIVINWGVNSSSDIDHFLVYHSETGDDVDYTKIAEVPADGSTKYSFKQISVFPGYHYYKIAAVMNDGSTVWSLLVDVVRIVSHG